MLSSKCCAFSAWGQPRTDDLEGDSQDDALEVSSEDDESFFSAAEEEDVHDYSNLTWTTSRVLRYYKTVGDSATRGCCVRALLHVLKRGL